MTAVRRSKLVPFLAACVGIALFSGMDAAMKGLAIAIGAYNAMLWRVLIGAVLGAVPWLVARPGWPSRSAMQMHLRRGAVVAVMAVCFFFGITRVPLAEGIALSFIAPLIALYLAAVLLGETIGRASITGSLLGIAGVAVLLAERVQGVFPPGSGWGVASILASAVLYAYNLILMRQQAQVASPTEVALFQNLATASWLLLAAPFFAVLPRVEHLPMLTLSAFLAMLSLLLLSWAYARAEAKVLVPVEYTAFVWAAIMGAIFYAEAVTTATLAGAVLIVAGCLIASLGGSAQPKPVEIGL